MNVLTDLVDTTNVNRVVLVSNWSCSLLKAVFVHWLRFGNRKMFNSSGNGKEDSEG